MTPYKTKQQRKKAKQERRVITQASLMLKSMLTDLTDKKDRAENRSQVLHTALSSLLAEATKVNPGPDVYLPDWESALDQARKALE